jgi:CBS domain-containing protein
MQLRELVRKKPGPVVTVHAHAPLKEAVRLLMQRNVGGVLVLGDDDSLRGFVSERDIVRALADRPQDVADTPVERIMRRPAPTCDADAPLQQVMSRMTRERLRHLVVLDNGAVAGVISVGDLVKHRLEQLETETGVLRDYVSAQRARS